jgi:hypothetical protein
MVSDLQICQTAPDPSARIDTANVQMLIVPFELTVKRFSADLSFFNASVICTQLERNNKSNIEKGRTP